MFSVFKKISLSSWMIIRYFFSTLLNSTLSMLSGSPLLATIICESSLVIALLFVSIKRYKSIKLASLLILAFCFISIILTIFNHPEYYAVMFVDRNIFSDIFGVGHGLFFFFILTFLQNFNGHFDLHRKTYHHLIHYQLNLD